jgi:hypothetical protein
LPWRFLKNNKGAAPQRRAKIKERMMREKYPQVSDTRITAALLKIAGLYYA